MLAVPVRCLAVAVVLTVVGAPATAQGLQAVPPDTLVAADYDARTLVTGPPYGGAARRHAPTATFELDLTGFPAEAQAAFEEATAIWATHIESPVPIRVRASFEELDRTTLGAAGPSCVEAEQAFLPEPATWYPIALADALAGRDLNPPGAAVCPGVDIVATFNSDLDVNNDGVSDWYFGTEGPPPSGRYDFLTVVLHELGHGLGFTGSFRVVTDEEEGCPASLGNVPVGFGCWGLGTNVIRPLIFDRFAEDAAGRALLDPSRYPNPSEALGAVLQSGAVFFDGPSTGAAHDAVPIDLYAPASFEPGSSFSHLDERVFPPGTANSLMTPQLGRAERILSPGPLTCAVFQDLGWRLGPDCVALLSGGVSGLASEVLEGTVTIRFSLGPGSGFTSVRPVREDANGQLEPVGTEQPVDAVAGGTYRVRIGELAPGSYTFRLRFERADGTTFLSPSVEVSVRPDTPLVVFPNPFAEAATVVVDAPVLAGDGEVTVDVYDTLGRRVAVLYEGVPSEPVLALSLSSQGLADGVYLVRAVGERSRTVQVVTHIR